MGLSSTSPTPQAGAGSHTGPRDRGQLVSGWLSEVWTAFWTISFSAPMALLPLGFIWGQQGMKQGIWLSLEER